MPLKLLFVAVLFTAWGLFGPLAWAEELNVYFKTMPGQESLRPFVAPATLSLLVAGADGKPVNQGTVSIRLDAPEPGVFFSTDYPLIENTLLSELSLPLAQGKASWRYLFPIRGEYRLTVDVDANDGRKTRRAFNIHVPENRAKWVALGALSVFLFGLGFVAGGVFTGTRANVIVILAATLFAMAENPGIERSGQSAKALLEIGPASVGAPSEVRWSLVHARRPDENAAFTLTITHLEKQKLVFAVDKVAVEDEWSMKFHFPDGGDYRVDALAQLAERRPVRTRQVVSVAGVEPPSGPMARALAYFIALVAVGLAAGRLSKRRKRVN